MGAVKFYRGSFDVYSEGLAEGLYVDGIFFDENKKAIYLNGKEYGGSSSINGGITEDWIIEHYGNAFHDVVQEITNNNGFVASFLAASDDSASGSISIPIASTNSAGLLSSTDKSKIDSFNVDNFVKKEEGKGLSSNDYTNDEKDKLSNIEENAQINTIEVIKINGVTQSINDKVIDLDIKSIVENSVNTTVSSAYQYRGSVIDASQLPTTNLNNGDVYNIENASQYGAAGVNVAWNSNANKWDSLGGLFSTADLEQSINTVKSDVNTLAGRVSTIESQSLNSRLNNVESSIDKFNGSDTTSGSIRYIAKEVAQTVVNNTLTWEVL